MCCNVYSLCCFKQKTAYEMRIRGGSSDAGSAHDDAADMMVGQGCVQLAAHLDLVVGHRRAAEDEGARRPAASFALAVHPAGHRLHVAGMGVVLLVRSEEHTSELQSLMRISYAVFCLKKKQHTYN